jgi:hypothetical protein
MAWVDIIDTTDEDDVVDILVGIRNALHSLASVKGILQDLRVTSTGAISVGTHGVTQSGNWNLGSVSQFGALNLSANNAVGNWQNQTAIQSFIKNIDRTS